MDINIGFLLSGLFSGFLFGCFIRWILSYREIMTFREYLEIVIGLIIGKF